jgi:hypothetical protein
MPQQQPNPLLMILMALAQRQRQGQQQGQPQQQRGMRPIAAQNRARTMGNYQRMMFGPGGELRQGGPTSNSAYTPDTWKMMNYLQQRYWNPGIMGNDTSPGMDVFAGFNRGTNWDPNATRAENSATNPVNVGNNTNMRGGDPGNQPNMPRQSDPALDRFLGQRGEGGMGEFLHGGWGGGGGGSYIGPYET